jgi:hypothetical protein
MRRLAVVLVLAVVAAAPVGAQPDAAWKRHAVPGLSVALPSTWYDATNQRAKLLAEVRRMHANDAQLATMIDNLLTAGDGNLGVRMIAFDLDEESLESGFATNLNVVRERTGLPLAAWREAALKALSSMSFVRQPIWSEPVRLAAGKAVRFRYKARFTVRGKPLDTAISQYGIVRDGAAYVLTYTTLPKLDRAYRAEFERSARSLRLS